MPEDVEQLSLALRDLVLVPLTIPARTRHGGRVERMGLLPLGPAHAPPWSCIGVFCECGTHTSRLTVIGTRKHKNPLRFPSPTGERYLARGAWASGNVPDSYRP